MIRIAEEAGLYEAEAELYGVQTIDVGEVNWNATAVQYMELNKQKTEAIQRVRELAEMFDKPNSILPPVVSRFAVAEAIYKALDGEQG
jgi:hypothetical protein